VVLHLNRLVLGAAGESLKPGNPWCDSAVLASAVLTVMMGFWLPGPLMGLIQGAARVVTGD